MNAFSFIIALKNYVIVFSFYRGDQIKDRAPYLFSMSDLQNACFLLKKKKKVFVVMVGITAVFCVQMNVQMKFQPISTFILGNK